MFDVMKDENDQNLPTDLNTRAIYVLEEADKVLVEQTVPENIQGNKMYLVIASRT